MSISTIVGAKATFYSDALRWSRIDKERTLHVGYRRSGVENHAQQTQMTLSDHKHSTRGIKVLICVQRRSEVISLK